MEAEPKDLEDLQQRARSGFRPKLVFFWSHQPAHPGSLGSECLSQWYPAPFVLDGVRFATAEHFMMWSKARLFNDADAQSQILAAESPAEAKQLGRVVRAFDDALWNEHRFEIVLRGSVAKFSQNVDLKRFLISTAPQVLAEASPTDRVWGIGLEAADERAQNPLEWRGLNLLGFALMRARALIGSI
jgi:hypothetical protein